MSLREWDKGDIKMGRSYWEWYANRGAKLVGDNYSDKNNYIENPKLAGSNIADCIPQKGPCPNDCNQCFYNRPGAFYSGMEPNIPSSEEVGNRIVRMNCGHDSNIGRDSVIKAAQQYENFFFNTSVPKFKFPGPIVYTANRKEEKGAVCLEHPIPNNVMFIRLRVSSANLYQISLAVIYYVIKEIPIVLTFMSYYDDPPDEKNYEWKVRHINKYWCPTREFKKQVVKRFWGYRLVTTCGTLDSDYCKDCRNCETYYWQTMKRMENNTLCWK